ncbi:hypothetical protein NL676_027304 [Syzygium grande]|nr:hypothetical protein NL676_027304 [Syzygium grande]
MLQKGIEGMNGKYLDGWVIFAEYARPRPPPTSPPNNGITAKRANRTRRKRPNRLMGQELSSEMLLFVQCMWRAMQE